MFITARIDSIFFFSTAVHIYNFHIFTAIIHHLEGFVWIQHNDQIPTSLLAQLVERSTGIAEVMGSNPVQAWIFSKYEDRFYIRRVIKCYQLSWERKLATAKSLKGWRSKRQPSISLRWSIYVFNSVNNTKLPFYNLPPTQHHSFFRDPRPKCR